jgi:hypothetical protein
MQGQDSLILNDGHSTSIVQALSAGAPIDLVQQLSETPNAGFGYYRPYITSVVDIARIMDSFHTAQYQYIPAVASEQDDQLALELNTPPSFHNPKSVLVVALPTIESPQMPPLTLSIPKRSIVRKSRSWFCPPRVYLWSLRRPTPMNGSSLEGEEWQIRRFAGNCRCSNGRLCREYCESQSLQLRRRSRRLSSRLLGL